MVGRKKERGQRVVLHSRPVHHLSLGVSSAVVHPCVRVYPTCFMLVARTLVFVARPAPLSACTYIRYLHVYIGTYL